MSNKLPFVGSAIPRDLRAFLDRVRELVAGSGGDRLVSANDLVSSGLATLGANGALAAASQTEYYATPPAPSNVVASAAIQNIIVTWDRPTYAGHAYAEVWVSSTTLLADAVLLGMTPGSVYVHAVGPSSTRYYWVRYVNVNDVKGAYNAVEGTDATTGADVAYLLETLTGQLTEDQLYTTLNNRIDLIDGTGVGSVDARLLAEATARGEAITAEAAARGEAITAEAAARGAAITAEAAARGAAITAEQTARQDADTSLAQQITTLTAAVNIADTSLASAISTEATTRADADTSLAQQITTLASTVTTADTTLTAAIQTEATTRATADTALSSSITTLASTVEGNTAAIATEATTRATADTSLSQQITTLASTVATADAALAASIQTEATTRAAADTSLSQQITTLTAAVNTADASLTSAIQAEATARANADSSQASQITTIAATITQTNLGKPLSLWTLNGQSIVTLTDGKVGKTALRLAGVVGGYPNQGYYVPIDRSKKYRARFWARPSSNAAGLLYFSLRQFLDDAGSAGPVNGGRSPYKPSGISRAQHNTTYGTDQWGEYSFVWDSADWQAGVKFVLPEFLDNYSGAAGYWDVQDFTFTDVTATENLSAAIQTEATARVNADGTLFAQYTVKVDTNGYVSGYGLASTANNATPSSTFAVRADTFYIANPSGPGVAPAMPFIVRTTPTVINGVSVPVGVYITDGFIQNGTITNAKIGNAAIDDAKIASLDAGKITTGYLAADRIQAGSIDAKIAVITSAQIQSLDASKIVANNLSSIKADLGTITAGKMQSGDGKMVIDLNNKYIRIEV